MIASNLHELLAAWHSVGYWLLYALLSGLLLSALARLHRLREWHHGYLAMMLGVLPWTWARLAALVLFADELWQHLRQALALEDGRTPGPDDSPLHVAYVALYRAVFR